MAEAKKPTTKKVAAAKKPAAPKKVAAPKVKKPTEPKANVVTPVAAETKKLVRRFTGTVVKKSGDKTIKVKVSRVIQHAKYGKRYLSATNHLVHDERNKSNVGDTVTIESSRPFSKTKRFVVVYTK